MRELSYRELIVGYLIVNTLFLLPANIEYFGYSFNNFLDFIVIFSYYYLMFGLIYAHLSLNAGFMLYSVLIFIKERKVPVFVVSILAVALSTWSNLFMALYVWHY